MHNLDFGLRAPLITAHNNIPRVNILAGLVVIPLIILAGFYAIRADFDNRQDLFDLSRKFSIDSAGEPFFPSVYDVGGKGAMFYPIWPERDYPVYPSLKERGASENIIIDTTVYRSVDAVDAAPELIWMLYPNLIGEDSPAKSPIRIVLNVMVDYTGKVMEVNIVDNSLLNVDINKTIIESARTSVFKPAIKNHQPVRCWVRLPLNLVFDA